MSIRYSVKWRKPPSTARSRGTLSSWISKSELLPSGRGVPAARRCRPTSLGRAQVRALVGSRSPAARCPDPAPGSPLEVPVDGRHLPRGSGEAREALSVPNGTRPGSSLVEPHLQARPQPWPRPHRPSPGPVPRRPSPQDPSRTRARPHLGMVMALCRKFSNFFWNEASCSSSAGRTCPGAARWQGQQPGSSSASGSPSSRSKRGSWLLVGSRKPGRRRRSFRAQAALPLPLPPTARLPAHRGGSSR